MKLVHVGLALLLALFLSACRQADPTPAAASDVVIAMAVRPQPPAVGAATLVISVSDTDGNPVTGAEVAARGDMSHAGMVPVTGSADAGSDGDYAIPFEWTMAGDWIVDITVTLDDGREVQQRFDVSVEGEMSMEHDAMTAEATGAADG